MAEDEAVSVTPDYTSMEPETLLGQLGEDGVKWAEAFVQCAAKSGHPGLDAGWVSVWFCQAIWHSGNLRKARG